MIPRSLIIPQTISIAPIHAILESHKCLPILRDGSRSRTILFSAARRLDCRRLYPRHPGPSLSFRLLSSPFVTFITPLSTLLRTSPLNRRQSTLLSVTFVSVQLLSHFRNVAPFHIFSIPGPTPVHSLPGPWI